VNWCRGHQSGLSWVGLSEAQELWLLDRFITWIEAKIIQPEGLGGGPKGVLSRYGEAPPMLTVCTYCRRVRHQSTGSVTEWVSAARCQPLTESWQVEISHGLCPDCYRGLIARLPTAPQPR
jgi:hypothetical protein